MDIKKKQKIVKKWFVELQNIICKSIEQLEKENEELEKKVLILSRRLEYYKAVVEEKE